MAQLIRWTRPRGAVHNVAHALSLKDVGANLLCVSDATLYVLQNWLDLDIQFRSRWADVLHENAYEPIHPDSPQWDAWVDLIHQIQSEVVDMSCDIVSVLEEIRDNIEATNTSLADLMP
jgi:hypothetical protein